MIPIDLTDNRDEILEYIIKDINEVVVLINSYEKIRLLGGLSSLGYGGLKFLRPTLPNIIETSVEYAISLSTSTINNVDLPPPSAEDILIIFNRLEKIREKYVEYILLENESTKYSIQEQQVRKKVIENTLTLRGEGFDIHVEEVFLELFNPHINFFKQNISFTPENILDTIYLIERGVIENQKKVKEHHPIFLKWLKSKKTEDFLDYKPDPFLFSKLFQLETKTNPQFLMVDEQFKFINNDLTNEEEQVLTYLSSKFGDNSGFLNPPFKGLPLDDSIVYSKPIIHDIINNQYYCFSPKLLYRNLFQITESMIQTLNLEYYKKTYLGKNTKGRSYYFENKVLNLLKRIIPNGVFYPNLKYKISNEEYEIDILIESDEYLYLIEVKSGIFSNAAKRGAIKNLKSDIKSFIGYATTQVNRTENYILKDNSEFYLERKNIKINNQKEIIKIVVSFASLTGITNQFSILEQLGMIDYAETYPIGFSIFDLMVVADIFNSNEKQFIDYLLNRRNLYTNDNLTINNEIDFLGLYLSRDFKKVIKSLKYGKKIEVSNLYRKKIEIYYKQLSEGKSATKPKKILD